MQFRLPSRQGLVGEWKLDGNALDTSGSGHNGTTANVTYKTTYRGYQSQESIFNGSSSNISLGTTSDLEPGANISFTVLGWWKSSSANAYQAIFTTRSTSTPTAFIDVFINGNGGTGTLDIYLGDGSSQIITTSNFGANDGKYHFFALVRDISNTKLNLYIDGILHSSPTLTRTGSTANGDTKYIGGRSINNFFFGNILGIRFLKGVALTYNNIFDYYLEGLRKLGGGSLYPLLDGVVGYYDFRGDLTSDIVGGNTVTNTNSVAVGTDIFGNTNAADFSSANTNKTLSFSSTAPFGLTRNGAQSYFFLFKRYGEIASGIESMVTSRFQFSGTDCQIYVLAYDYNAGTRRLLASAANRNNSVLTYNTNLGTTWHSFALTYAGGSDTAAQELFLDGVSVASGNQTTGSTSTGNQGFWMGCNNGTLQFASGIMGMCLVFNKRLSVSECALLHNLVNKDYILPFN